MHKTRRRLSNIEISEDSFRLVQQMPKGVRGAFFRKAFEELILEASARGNKAMSIYAFGEGNLREFLK